MSRLIEQWSQQDSDNYTQDITVDMLRELWYTRVQEALLKNDRIAAQYALDMWRAQ